MKRALLLVAAFALLGAGTADAGGSIWDQLTAEDPDGKRPSAAPPPGLSEYERQMWFGDKASLAATKHRSFKATVSRVRHYLQYAINAYEKAIAADPSQAEPHYRLGWLIDYHYLDETWGHLVSDRRAELHWRTKLLEHWERFVELAPLDPRIGGELGLLAARSIHYTKLNTKEGNEKAVGDYAALFERNDPSSFEVREAGRLASNRAEIHMMLGQLPEAIEWYRRALGWQRDNSWAFGLAVAYDRAGYSSRARELMSSYATAGALEQLVDQLVKKNVFYVPEAEVYYYFGLMHEVLGNYDLAIDRFQKFIASGAHPEFQARARHNITVLKKKLKSRRGSLGVEQWTRTWDQTWPPQPGSR